MSARLLHRPDGLSGTFPGALVADGGDPPPQDPPSTLDKEKPMRGTVTCTMGAPGPAHTV